MRSPVSLWSSDVGHRSARRVRHAQHPRSHSARRPRRGQTRDLQLSRLRARRRSRARARRRHSHARALLGQRDGLRARPRGAFRCAARRALERHRLARARVRRHAAEELHSSERARGVGVVRLCERQSRVGPRLRARVHSGIRGRVADRQRRLSCALRGRLAHHVDDRRVRRGGRYRQVARPHHEADGLGVRARGDAGRRHSRDVRLDGEVVSAGPRRAERLHGCAARPSRLHGRRARARRTARLRRSDGSAVRPRQGHGGARQGLRAARQRLQALRLRPRRASDDRRLQPAASRVSPVARLDRRRAAARRAARARSLQQEHLDARAREQVLDLSRGGHRPRARQGRPARVHRGGRRRSGVAARARRDHGRRRLVDHRGPSPHRSDAYATARRCRSSSSNRSATCTARSATSS